MKNKDETNHLMLENSNNDSTDLSKRISSLEHQFTIQNHIMRQQLEEMHDYCKFFSTLYSDLKMDFVHTKHLLLSKIAHENMEEEQDDHESERMKELEEEIRKLKLENGVLKTKLALKNGGMENGKVNPQEDAK